MAGCLRINVDLGSSANEFAADRFVNLSNHPSYPPSIPSELFDTALENCSRATMLGASRRPRPANSQTKFVVLRRMGDRRMRLGHQLNPFRF